MQISKENALILGLSKAEINIIDSLESKDSKDKNMSIIEISKETGIPRTSLYYMLPKLEKRGFIEKKTNNRKVFWRKSRIEDFQNKFIRTIQEISKNKIKPLSPIVNSKSIKILQGVNEMTEIFDELSNLPSRSRVFSIQPDQSITDVIKKLPIKKALETCDNIKHNKIIMDGIVHEKSINSISKNARDGKIAIQLLESFGDRSADTAKMPESFLHNTHAETYLYEDKVTILNWDKEIAIIIKDKDIFQLIKEMFNSTKYLMDRYDQNEKVARKLVELNSVE